MHPVKKLTLIEQALEEIENTIFSDEQLLQASESWAQKVTAYMSTFINSFFGRF
jgi:hypothetical protein